MMRVHLMPHTNPRFTIVTSELEPVPLVRTEDWIRRRLGADGFTSSGIHALTTACGWPVVVAHGRLGGVPTLRAYYQFLDLGALAEARADDAGALALAWDVLATARPDYTGEHAALAQLFA